MDGKHFDQFTKTVAGTSRRSLVKAVFAAGLGGSPGQIGLSQTGSDRASNNCFAGQCVARFVAGTRRAMTDGTSKSFLLIKRAFFVIADHPFMTKSG